MKSTYYKAATLFSRNRQEYLVGEIEKNLHEIILLNASKRGSCRENREAMEKISEQINFSILNYYFEGDLLDYLISLDAFISKYEKL